MYKFLLIRSIECVHKKNVSKFKTKMHEAKLLVRILDFIKVQIIYKQINKIRQAIHF